MPRPDLFGPEELDGVAITHHVLPSSDVDVALHVATAGPDDGVPIVLLHGFPECWLGWRHVIPGLVRAGFRVIAPDQRGYHGSDAPRPARAYTNDHLTADVIAILDALVAGGRPVHLVGHDWGGGVAWGVAAAHPDRLASLTVVNCPWPAALQKALRSDAAQLRRSWYIAMFQLPWLPEALLSGGLAERAVVGSAPEGTFDEATLAHYRAGWSAPGRMRGMVNWYRASLLGRGPKAPVTVPTRLVWGTADHALGTALIPPTLAVCTDADLVRVDRASHWVPAERPREVLTALTGHVARHGGADRFVYKLAPRDAWSGAADPWPGNDLDRQDGFVHLCAHAQLRGVVDTHFADAERLDLLRVDPAKLPAGALRWEVSRGGDRFPHLHAPLPHGAVVDRWELGKGAQGFALPPAWRP